MRLSPIFVKPKNQVQILVVFKKCNLLVGSVIKLNLTLTSLLIQRRKSFVVLWDYNVSSCQQLFTIKYEVISVSLTILTCLFLRKSKEKKNLHSFSLIYFTLLFPLYNSSQLILLSTIPQAYFTYIYIYINQSSWNQFSNSTLCEVMPYNQNSSSVPWQQN